MSDLISKKELYRKLGEVYNKGYLTWGANEIIRDIIGECDSVENKCFDGMTNGEVLQALFPNMKTEDTSFKPLIGTDIDRSYVVFQRDWWNAPYKAESEEQ